MNSKTQQQRGDFFNRIQKRYRHLKKWARRSEVSCFRIFDKDIPEIPLALDIYQKADSSDLYGHLALYQRPYEKDPDEEVCWLSQMKEAVSEALEIPLEAIFTKTRQRQKGESQYEKVSGKSLCIPIEECGAKFLINLTDYIDTGLFFDHRPLRSLVRNSVQGKDVLNLFCYTGSFSVYAALGGAASVDSVDLSKNYLSWAKENFFLNGIQNKTVADYKGKYRFIQEDALEFICAAKKTKKAFRNRWDCIILDPPTFSNSKRTENTLDINRQWPFLVNTCKSLLKKDGVLFFSTNSKSLKFIPDEIDSGSSITDITESTIPEDFKGSKPHRCWKITQN